MDSRLTPFVTALCHSGQISVHPADLTNLKRQPNYECANSRSMHLRTSAPLTLSNTIGAHTHTNIHTLQIRAPFCWTYVISCIRKIKIIVTLVRWIASSTYIYCLTLYYCPAPIVFPISIDISSDKHTLADEEQLEAPFL